MVNYKIRTAVAAWLVDATAAEATYGHISTWETGGVTDMSELFCAHSWCDYYNSAAASFNEEIGAWDTSGVTTMWAMFYKASAFNQDISGWAVDSVTDMSFMFDQAYSFDQDLGWCVDDDVSMARAFSGTPCSLTSCGVKQAAGGCAPTPAPTTPAPTPASTPAPTPTPTVTPRKKSSSGGGAILFAGDGAIAALLLAVGACYFCCRRRKASTMDKADGPSSANPEPTELPPPDEESLETRAAAEAKAAETAERPGLARKLSSFLFGEQEEEPTALTVAEAEEAPPAEQPPPLPPRRTEPEPAAKAEEMYNQIAAWYSEPENAALRKIWGAYPDPDDFQTWPGFVAVTNAFLDREAG